MTHASAIGSTFDGRIVRDLEESMAAPGFYEDRTAAQPVIDRHQALMWTVGDLMHQWEELQKSAGRAELSLPVSQLTGKGTTVTIHPPVCPAGASCPTGQ